MGRTCGSGSWQFRTSRCGRRRPALRCGEPLLCGQGPRSAAPDRRGDARAAAHHVPPRRAPLEAAEAGHPGQGPPHLPAVSSEPAAVLNAAPGDTQDDATAAALGPTEAVVVALVGVELAGPPPRPAARLAAIRRIRAGCRSLLSPGQTSCPARLCSNSACRRRAAVPAARGAGEPTHLPPANPATAASRSCPTRSPSRPEGPPNGCRS